MLANILKLVYEENASTLPYPTGKSMIAPMTKETGMFDVTSMCASVEWDACDQRLGCNKKSIY